MNTIETPKSLEIYQAQYFNPHPKMFAKRYQWTTMPSSTDSYE